ncbi:RagB/SusD family nutrient uptake outer membrane protein [Hymenobacter sp. BRD128]|uniref:RagB/SusD family nutrient uptake outer membrane protein n=1 Tax=Hymenobacter sp. BRD128 TaxID=2675878 RepID=UPI001566A1F8|nr:RagB/SusD family nutrient uptake outer membrane protein [Hymenobacter sp. BRD128]QKG55307.1 RagB/SusD family nutrient uptake outer membrane protein [Hymenobacter sp. BRD128]
MKKYLLPALGALSLLASCTFLDKQPLDTITSSSFFQNANDAEASLTAAYDALQQVGTYGQDLIVMGEMPSDNCTSTNGDVNAMDKIIWNSTTSQVYNVYRNNFQGVNRANIVIKYVPTVAMDTARRSQIVGEAKFLRALYYFNLARAYGGVPLRLAPSESGAASDVNTARSTQDQVYDQVVTDLQQAIGQMANKQDNRATKNSARALLARVQLTRRNWPAALAAANSVTGAALATTPNSLYPAENRGSESLFEVQFAGNADGGNFLPDLLLPSPLATYSFPKFNIPTAELIAYADTSTANGDKRWSYNGAVNASNGNRVGRSYVSMIVGTGSNNNDQGPFVYKWRSIGNGFNSTDNTYVLRYAEVLLTAAEASNEQNGPATALGPLNQVRQRAGLAALTAASPQAASKQALRAEIDRQRRLELAFEGERWWDLTRYARHTLADPSATHPVTALDLIATQHSTGTAPNIVPGPRDPNYLLFPIPQAELNTNPLIAQNPGY